MIKNERKNQVSIITINRPEKYNALNIDLLKLLDENITQAIDDQNCRSIILTGTGDKAFIAGADIEEMTNLNYKQAQEFCTIGQDLTLKIQTLNIPVIAAINGVALGGGCEFALSCHIRYASDNAILGQPEVGLGLIAGWGGTQRLPRLVGQGISLEMLLSGKSITANEAKSIGLVNNVFPQSELMDESLKLANLIATKAPIAIANTIRAVNEGFDADIKEGLANENKLFSTLFDSLDIKEGMSAFKEKRQPEFIGK